MSSSDHQMHSEAHRHAQALLRFLAHRRDGLSPLLILTHDFPDPDAIASAFALQHLAVVKSRIEARIAYGGIVGRMENRAMVRTLRIRMHRFHPILLKRHANVALVDTQPAFENNAFPGNRKAAIVLDQHPSDNPPDAGLAIVDSDCGATSVLVAQALLQAGMEIPARVATALAYGILTDTLDLYRARRPDVAQTYLAVLPHADMRALARIQNPIRPRKFFSVLGKGIREAVLYRRLVVTHLGEVDTPDRVSQVAEFLLTYPRAHWCFATGRFKGRLHASLRTIHQDAQAAEILRDVFEKRNGAMRLTQPAPPAAVFKPDPKACCATCCARLSQAHSPKTEFSRRPRSHRRWQLPRRLGSHGKEMGRARARASGAPDRTVTHSGED